MTMKKDPLRPEPPFIWPEPRILEHISTYENSPPFDAVMRESDSMFGVVSSLYGHSIDVLESWFESNDEFKASLILAVYPTCPTAKDDLLRLLDAKRRYEDRLSLRIHPYKEVTDRPTNALCFIQKESSIVHMVTGAMEGLGFDPSPDGKVNFVFQADPALVESFNRYFTWLWGTSREITAEGVTRIPTLVLAQGTVEGARQWAEYLGLFMNESGDVESSTEIVQVDSESGEVKIVNREGIDVTPPAEEIGLKRLGPLAEIVTRLYNKGSLVSIDKLSRIPPLDAPIDPRMFGDSTEIQQGNVTRRVSMRVSIIDDKTLKEIEKRRQAMRTLLAKFTFGLADNMRWMPNSARALFESELERVNIEGQKLISDLLKGNIEGFIKNKKEALVSDINSMHRALGRQGTVPEDVINNVIESLKVRLNKAQSANFMPKLTYSSVTFRNSDNTWASPWGQAYALLSDMAMYSRKALTDGFFFRGIRVSEDDLIQAMNAADDAVLREDTTRGIKDRCRAEIDVLLRIEKSSIDVREKCDLVWRILNGGELNDVTAALDEKEKEEKLT